MKKLKNKTIIKMIDEYIEYCHTGFLTSGKRDSKRPLKYSLKYNAEKYGVTEEFYSNYLMSASSLPIIPYGSRGIYNPVLYWIHHKMYTSDIGLLKGSEYLFDKVATLKNLSILVKSNYKFKETQIKKQAGLPGASFMFSPGFHTKPLGGADDKIRYLATEGHYFDFLPDLKDRISFVPPLPLLSLLYNDI